MKTQRYAMVVAYVGARYKGWQRGNGRTVQGTIEEALAQSIAESDARTTGFEVRIDGASRTDAGVNAEGQVISVDLPDGLDTAALLALVNRTLPADIAIRSIDRAGSRFHARYLATAKTYRYRIVDGPVGIPSIARLAWRVRDELDLTRMREASQAFAGTHDFSAFTADRGKKEKTRSVSLITVTRPEIEGGTPLDVTIRGDGFLWNQVRIMVAALVGAGRGELNALTIRSILESRDRSRSPAPAPAHGLTLLEVEYPEGALHSDEPA